MSVHSFVTALNTDNYLPGVLVLDKSIRATCTHPLFVLVSHGLSPSTYETLRRHGIHFGYAEDIRVDAALLSNIDDTFTHWKNTLFKFRIFELTQFEKIVFIDSDIMVLESMDDLFERPDMSAVIAGKSFPGNDSWRDLCSGVLVIRPRDGVVEQLIAAVPAVSAAKRSFGDQDVLSAHFSGWTEDAQLHLPEGYNVFFDHYQFYRRHGGVKAVHFIGREKPWMMTGLQWPQKYLRCIVKGNSDGIAMLRRYRQYLREVTAHG